MKKLASIRKISNIIPIEGIDFVETAVIDFWNILVKKNEIEIGSLVVFFEIDSWIPKNIAPFLSSDPWEKYNGIEGKRIKTIRFRGIFLQGLIITIPEMIKRIPKFGELKIEEDMDVTEILGVIEWKPIAHTEIDDKYKKDFPDFIPKIKNDKIQNMSKMYEHIQKTTWEVAPKILGLPVIIYRYVKNNIVEEGVCSDTHRIIEHFDKYVQDIYWRTAHKYGIFQLIKNNKINVVLYGTTMKNNGFCIQDIYDIDRGCYLYAYDIREYIKNTSSYIVNIFYYADFSIDKEYRDLLEFVKTKHICNGHPGLIFKNTDQTDYPRTFEVMCNSYLLNN